MRARMPDKEGLVDRDGVKLHYDIYGAGPDTIVFVPAWSIAHSRVFKAQVPYFSERFRCVTYDGRGNGKSDRPEDVAAYSLDNYAADLLAVMDATGTDKAILVGLSFGGLLACMAAAYYPERVKAAILAEEDLPRDPKRQFESLTESTPYMFDRIFVMGDPPDYEPTADRSIAGIASATGKDPWEVLYDELASGTLLLGAFLNYGEGSHDALREMIAHENTVIGLSDGGAHVKMICDASMPTFLLTHWVRDRDGKRLALEEAVKALTSDPARVVGLRDRGILRQGYKADINVIDLAALRLHTPRVVQDMPAGGRRLDQGADGFVATFVAGKCIARNGTPTGNFPGRLVRGRQAMPAESAGALA